MNADLFWLSDAAWTALEPHLPRNQPGARRVDDRRVISGILHVLKVGCRWRDVPAEYGPAKTVYNRYHRWSQRRIWHRIFEKMAASGPVPEELSIDSTHIKAHRSAQGSKGGPWAQAIGTSRGGRTSKIHCLADDCGRPVAFSLTPGNVADIKMAIPLLTVARPTKRLLADKAYDADSLRQWLEKAKIKAVIPSSATRRTPYPLDRKAYRRRNVIERLFCRLKNWRRIATRYDRLASNYLAAVALVSAVIAWT
ncbi:IS5 family transposase [Brucella anthropi]|nr:IS5 family transposase [Brucella anthropi]MCH4543953.1 IS5 family transposase [Ochrobactrum sp. A-1]MDG9793788.1 IS5 family transposase [Brucella anthropi]MDH0583664.1 IS5 family transposase [Brucella anthropi]MDH0820182.1 IS5 family transposase [Brucella anthropi]MDH2087032.1 IS5 family transposase [Brucella anthropi]